MSKQARFRFLLYVADHAPNSERAAANLAALCREHLEGRHEVERVDVFEHPERALAEGILLTPTLVKLGPGRVMTIVGTLSDKRVVLEALGLETLAA